MLFIKEKMMLNQMQKNVCALAVLATLSLPVLAESVDVRVTGTINPTACTPTLTGGGVIDYGSINPNALAADDFTLLQTKELDFAITCDAPAKVALVASSGRGASAVKADGTLGTIVFSPVPLFNIGNAGAVGLGLNGTKGIGGYGIRIVDSIADGAPVDLISSNDKSSWAKSTSSLFQAQQTRHSSWATAGTTTPVAFTNLTGKLGVQAYINKTSELDLTQQIVLDGMSTLELVYL